MLTDRGRRLAVVATVVLGVAVFAVVRLGGGSEDRPEPVQSEAILCAEVHAVPAEASSGDLQRAPSPEVAQDSGCDELAASPAPGHVVLPRHSEVDDVVGNVVMSGELRFDPQRRCFYVETADEPIGVVWPARFTGRADPPRITDDDGSIVVSAGESFTVRGRYLSGVSEPCGPADLESTGFVAAGDVVLTNG